MKKQQNTIIIDSKERLFLKSDNLAIGHISSSRDYSELLDYYNKNNLTCILPKDEKQRTGIIDLGWHYIFKDESQNIFGDTLLMPLNITRSVGQIMPLFSYMASEDVYKKTFEFLCYAAKNKKYKWLFITVSEYEEYRKLLELGYKDITHSGLNRIKDLPLVVKNSFTDITEDFFTVQVELNKMPKTELEKSLTVVNKNI